MSPLDFHHQKDDDVEMMLRLWFPGRPPVRAFFQFRLDSLWVSVSPCLDSVKVSKHTRVEVQHYLIHNQCHHNKVNSTISLLAQSYISFIYFPLRGLRSCRFQPLYLFPCVHYILPKEKIAVVNQMNDIVTISIVHAVPSPHVLTFSTHSFSLQINMWRTHFLLSAALWAVSEHNSKEDIV